MSTLTRLIAQAKENRVTVAVAAAEDMEVIKAVREANKNEVAHFQLYGDEKKLLSLIERVDSNLLNNKAINIISAPSPEEAAYKAVKAVHNKTADVLMKGNIPTKTILKAALDKQFGLRTSRVLSHVALFEVPIYERPIIITDAAMNIAPTVSEKSQIIKNAVSVAHAIGLDYPKVAVLASVEVVNENMPATLHAKELVEMFQQETNCFVEGPFALDNAISPYAAEHKGIGGKVAGRADILLAPNIESGNILYKSLIYFAKARVGAIIAGAKAPIVLTSRADSAESKLHSLALAICISQHESREEI
jgi:phosphate butyryltransferase